MRSHFTYDELLTLKDTGLVAASGAGQVAGADKILDLGGGLVEGHMFIDLTSLELNGSRAQGTLTVAVNPTAGNSAQQTLAIPVNPSDGHAITIGTTTYTWKDTPASAGHIKIGADAAASQATLVKVINGAGVEGTDYFAGTATPHPSVRISNFTAGSATVTAIATGVAGNAIATTETMAGAGNQFGGATLAGGTDGDTMTIGTKVYYFDATGQLDNIDGHIEVGANVAATQANIVNAINRTGTPGTGYAAAMTAHPDVTIAAFATNAAVITAKVEGTAGNNIDTTETFANAGNVFDAAKLGTTRAGAAANERYDILLQGSNSATFASGIVTLARVAVGVAALVNASANTGTGRIILPFRNEFLGATYRYVRAYTAVTGTDVPSGINYTARVAKRN